MDSLKNLNSLTIEGTFLSQGTISTALTLPPTLRTFVLRVPVSSCSAIVSSILSNPIPRLRELSLEVTCDCNTSSYSHTPQAGVAAGLLSLLSLSTSTLETLKLRLCSAPLCTMNASKFCKHLQNFSFPQLCKLNLLLCSTFPAVDEASLLASESIKAFLSTSTPKVTDLTLDVYPALLLASSLPGCNRDRAERTAQVQTLHLHLPDQHKRRRLSEFPAVTPFSFDQLSTYIHSQLPTLVELDLGNMSIRFQQLQDLLKLFRGRNTCLTNLRLTVWRLEPRVFVCIFSFLPQLRGLAITYESVQPDEYDSPYADVYTRINAVRLGYVP